MPSLTDWDFENENWRLHPTIYHTAAPSFQGTVAGVALVKHAISGALSNGRLVVWAWTNDAGVLALLVFRNQVVDGSAELQDSYYIWIEGASLGFRAIVGGEYLLTIEKDHTWNWAVETWYKLRVTWWTSAERIYVRVERWTGTEWVTLGGDADTDFEDVNDRWKDSETNRVGVQYVAWTRLYDDIEVWG